MSHLDEGRLHELLDGQLPSAEAGQLRKHLDGCPVCQGRLEEAGRLRDGALGLVEMLDPPPGVGAPASAPVGPPDQTPITRPHPKPTGAGWATLAWAASLVLALGAGYLLAGGGKSAMTVAPVSEPTALALGETEADSPSDPKQTVSPNVEGAGAAPPAATRRSATTNPIAEDRRAASAAPAPARDAPSRQERSNQVDAVADLASDELVTDSMQQLAKEEAPAPRLRASRKDVAKALVAPSEAPLEAVGRAVAAGQPIGALEAIRELGGAIRLIEGWQPGRFELAAPRVRVHYATAFGPVVLEQWREADSIRVRLLTPPSTPRDSVAAWESRIK